MPKKKPIKKFDRSEAQRLRAEITPKLQEIAGQLGLTASVGTIKIQSDSVKCPITFSLGAEAAADLEDRLKTEFVRNCGKVGLKPEHFGKEFHFPGDRSTFKIVGVLPNRPKNNVRIERTSTGKEFICNSAEVLRFLGEGDGVSVGDYEVID